ncbi:two-component system regulatory protein YycI [Clostridium aminobutyricum]|uniref:Two-component system regulatory protein YycI n=1 Tax=Clostridium aminobutyricum TaxID=33953 RepID=A0A939D888_CLOAM|nr:two-component system regulatory protein YycI [Clostridium aminobutyricum]MBN7773304.1 two-component system regulatory protein YycI [Clostridium aminobutyricum]
MDWSKAKNILIIALIATNLFLLFTYLDKNYLGKQETDETVLFSVLADKNIFVKTKLPTKYDKLPAVTVEYDNDREEQIKANLFRTIYNVSPQAGETEYKESATRFLEDCGLMNENILLEGVFKQDGETIVRFKACYRGILIEDSPIECKYEDGNLKDVTEHWLTPIEQSKKKLKIISPEQALLIFISEKKNNDRIIIEKMTLVFWINESSFNGEALVSDTAFPAWQITYNDGQKKYIEAYET